MLRTFATLDELAEVGGVDAAFDAQIRRLFGGTRDENLDWDTLGDTHTAVLRVVLDRLAKFLTA